MREQWWCIKSPEYGLLPFTCATEKRSTLIHFICNGKKAEDFWLNKALAQREWKRHYRDGFRCVKILVQEKQP